VTPSSRTVNGPRRRLLPVRSPRIYYFSNVTAETHSKRAKSTNSRQPGIEDACS
jgi:hypothetical protein